MTIDTGTLPKYKKNLSIVLYEGELYVKSYNTRVAIIYPRFREIHRLGYWSSTTSKHINYVQRLYRLNFV
jgi:hypothetical protein